MRKKPNLAARMEKCAHLLVKEPELFRGGWGEKFGYGELHVELGCGKGRFTVETAKAEAAKADTAKTETENKTGVFIAALEKSADAMIIALERAASEELRNLRFIHSLADNLTDYFAPGEVSRIYLNFCDPWPSNRHAKRRLTNRRFLDLYMQALYPGGEIHFKTDNLPLFEFSLREFEFCGFSLIDVTRGLHKDGPAEIMTDYELKFHNQGFPVYKCIVKK